MNKKTIITALLALVALTRQAQIQSFIYRNTTLNYRKTINIICLSRNVVITLQRRS